MRARYYSPTLRRFINADILAGQISNAVTLNRYAYANGNPVSFVDPFGLYAPKWYQKNDYSWKPEKQKLVSITSALSSKPTAKTEKML